MNFTKRQENLPYQDFTQFKITRKMKDYKEIKDYRKI